MDVEIIDLCCIDQNIYNYNEEVTHEINYYYRMKTLSDLPEEVFTVKEIDKGIEKEHKFHWIDVKKLSSYNLRPVHIAQLLSKNSNVKNEILLSNE